MKTLEMCCIVAAVALATAGAYAVTAGDVGVSYLSDTDVWEMAGGSCPNNNRTEEPYCSGTSKPDAECNNGVECDTVGWPSPICKEDVVEKKLGPLTCVAACDGPSPGCLNAAEETWCSRIMKCYCEKGWIFHKECKQGDWEVITAYAPAVGC